MICTPHNCSGHKIKEDEKVGACGTYGEKRNAYRVLVRKHGRKRSRHRQEHNNKSDFKEMELEDAGRIYMGQEKRRWRVLVNTVTNFQVLLSSGNFLTSR
jgi:hypothetical protein